MIGSNLVVEGVPGSHHHHHNHHHHHHVLAGAGSHPLHSFSAIPTHLSPNTASSRATQHLTNTAATTTFPEPSSFLKNANGPLLPPPEFAHPLPKPAPIVPRYNGVTSSLNGAIKNRGLPPPLPAKYNADTDTSPVPVNLVQSKDTPTSDGRNGGSPYGLYAATSRLYPPHSTYSPHFATPPPPPPPTIQTGPYGPLYPPNPFTPMLHRDGRISSLLPLQQYPDSNTPILKTPPNSMMNGGGINGVKSIYEPPVVPIMASEANGGGGGGSRTEKRPFKVPSGKEGSLKHRILTTTSSTTTTTMSMQGRSSEARGQRKMGRNSNAHLPPPTAISSMMAANCMQSERNGGVVRNSPTETIHPTLVNGNCNGSVRGSSGGGGICNGEATNNSILPKFIKGSLIKLADGSLKKVEDMRTEDFVSCVENSTTMRIDSSTVVRIQENAFKKGVTMVTLSYGEDRNEVDVETTAEHPYFVVKRGWSSYAPKKTLQMYHLSCHQLQVGDVCLTLSPIMSSPIKKTNTNRNDNVQRARNGHRESSSNGNGGGGGGDVVVDVKGSTTTTTTTKKNDLKISCKDGSGGSDEIRFNVTNKNNNCGGYVNHNGLIDGNCTNIGKKNNGHYAAGKKATTATAATGAIINNNTSNCNNDSDETKTNYKKSLTDKILYENDTNNNSNNISDKYDGAPARKKRRWSAPDQITDDYQSSSSSPLSSPLSSSSSSNCASILSVAKNV